ncbi:MAG: class I SAM-dependent methyltransferase [Lachnospiraceae bacterium]|nr:class I SAM-dependent methyltransferase [Lachnospiraceae bacterium]
MTEKIGKVSLDLTDYSGKDLYSEGDAEDVLLSIVKEHGPEEYNHQIMAHQSWSTLYHLSDLRGNIIDFLPVKEGEKVLEVGAGCGAVTSALVKTGAAITCVELSKKRSLINAHRNSGCENLEIKVGNFQDIEKRLDKDYDHIMLIGVFEYAASYIDAPDPYRTFMKILLGHLKEGGRMMIAIENKYGLKYFAGCREDHLGTFFGGIEGYEDSAKVRTFSRDKLRKMAEEEGCSVFEYYPYPDYKLPVTVFSQERLPYSGETDSRGFNFDADRALLFDESAATTQIIEDGMFPFFSNSFLFELKKGSSGAESDRVIYSRHSNERSPLYAIRTDIIRKPSGEFSVKKCPLSERSEAHVRSLADKYEKLKAYFEGSRFAANHCSLSGRDAEFEFIEGDTLERELIDLLKNGREDVAYSLMKEFSIFLESLGRDEDGNMSVCDVDMIFSNIIRENGTWHVLDYEWTDLVKAPCGFVFYRALKYFAAACPEVSLLDMCIRFGIDEDAASEYEEKEALLQQRIAQGRLSLIAFDAIFGKGAYTLKEMMRTVEARGRIERAKLYFDCGEGFSEGNCCYTEGRIIDRNKLIFDITLPNNIKALRIDPSDNPCMIKLFHADARELSTNGHKINNDTIYFGEPDPQMIFDLRSYNNTVFHIEYQIGYIEEGFQERINEVVKKATEKWKGLFGGKEIYEKVTLS